MNNLFSETLKKLRTERGLSQTQLGKQLFVNQSTIARWESGNRLPDAAMIASIICKLSPAIDSRIIAANSCNRNKRRNKQQRLHK